MKGGFTFEQWLVIIPIMGGQITALVLAVVNVVQGSKNGRGIETVHTAVNGSTAALAATNQATAASLAETNKTTVKALTDALQTAIVTPTLPTPEGPNAEPS